MGIWNESQLCHPIIPCPINGGWSSWGAWGPCSVTCGQTGVRSQFRNCSNPEPAFGGKNCGGENTTAEDCGLPSCPPSMWSMWSEWSECPATCGTHQQIRTRNCSDPQPQNGKLACPGFGNETKNCESVGSCPVDGEWSQWGPWEQCSLSCGSGTRNRIRTCTAPAPAFGGKICNGTTSSSEICNREACPISVWGEWSTWSECPTCGISFRSRTRNCSDPQPQNGRLSCPGFGNDTQKCESNKPCPVDGGWSLWGPWEQCPVSCGSSQRSRVRTCTAPAPAFEGKVCNELNRTSSEPCNLEACPSTWGDWGKWSVCSKTCGSVGQRFRERICMDSTGSQIASDCVGQSLLAGVCLNDPCPAFEMFITKPQDQTVNVGGDVKFICQYKPEELSSKWYKGTDLVQYALEQERLRIDNTSLMILDVKLEDQGTYTCKVGQDEESAFLKISTSSDRQLTSAETGVIAAVIVVGLIFITIVFLFFLCIGRSGFAFFKNHPPIEVQGAQLTQSQQLSTSTEVTLVSNPEVQNHVYQSIDEPQTFQQKKAESEQGEALSSMTTERSSSVPVLDSHQVNFQEPKKPRPRTLSIDGKVSMRIKGAQSPGAHSAPATPADRYTRIGHRPPGHFRGPGILRIPTSPLSPNSPRPFFQHHSHLIDDELDAAATTQTFTLPRSRRKPTNDSGPGSSRRTLSNPQVANPWSDPGSDYSPTTESIPMRDMSRNRAPAPFESPAAGDFTAVGQTNYPERYRPSGSSTPGFCPPPPIGRDPPKRSLSYDPRYVVENRPSPVSCQPLFDIDPCLERIQSPRSQESDDVFDSDSLPVDTEQNIKRRGPIRMYSVPKDRHQNSLMSERPRSETNL